MTGKRRPGKKQSSRILHILLHSPVKYLIIVICVLLAILIMLGLSGVFNKGSKKDNKAENTSSVRMDETEMLSEMPEDTTITIDCTGSMIMHDPILYTLKQTDDVYDFSPVFQYIKPYYDKADYTTCEMEGAVTLNPWEVTGVTLFRLPPEFIDTVADCGIDLQLLSSNHVYDSFGDGLVSTMDYYDKMNYAYTGIRRDETSPRWYIADIKGIKVGFFDYTFQTTGNGTYINAIKVDEQDAKKINSFNPEELTPFFEEADTVVSELKQAGADFIISCIHWGLEYYTEPVEYQIEIAQHLCDSGVNALIGGHPHCLESVDVLESADGKNKMFCAYSVGNALSNQLEEYMYMDMPGGYTEDGVILTLQLTKDETGKVSMTGVDAMGTWVYGKIVEGQTWPQEFRILPLDDVDSLEKLTGIKGISKDAEKASERVEEVIGEGMQKAQQVFGTVGENC
ncbi:MAG: CapA family protein [Eubacterium sp.]|nr:CapA family protein [Eubacterium sp.]